MTNTNTTYVEDPSTLPVKAVKEVSTVGIFTQHPVNGVCAVFALERKGKKPSRPNGSPCLIFPTGMVEQGEGTAAAAAREALEEAGVSLPIDLTEIKQEEQYRTYDGKTAIKYVIHYFASFLPWEQVQVARRLMADRWQTGATTPEEIYETFGMAILPLAGLGEKLEVEQENSLSVRFATSVARGCQPDDFAKEDIIFSGVFSLNKSSSQEYGQCLPTSQRLLTMGFAHDHHRHIPFMLEYLSKKHA